jgi:hypothetical protein
MSADLAQLVTVLVPVFAGLFGLLKYLDVRNRELKAQRYQAYSEVIRSLSGERSDGSHPYLVEQISAIYRLEEFREFKEITIQILEASMTNESWNKSLGKYAVKVITNLRREQTH